MEINCKCEQCHTRHIPTPFLFVKYYKTKQEQTTNKFKYLLSIKIYVTDK